MPIAEALLKYGKNHFALLIEEYVDAKELTLRETRGARGAYALYPEDKNAYVSGRNFLSSVRNPSVYPSPLL